MKAPGDDNVPAEQSRPSEISVMMSGRQSATKYGLQVESQLQKGDLQ